MNIDGDVGLVGGPPGPNQQAHRYGRAVAHGLGGAHAGRQDSIYAQHFGQLLRCEGAHVLVAEVGFAQQGISQRHVLKIDRVLRLLLAAQQPRVDAGLKIERGLLLEGAHLFGGRVAGLVGPHANGNAGRQNSHHFVGGRVGAEVVGEVDAGATGGAEHRQKKHG